MRLLRILLAAVIGAVVLVVAFLGTLALAFFGLIAAMLGKRPIVKTVRTSRTGPVNSAAATAQSGDVIDVEAREISSETISR